MGPVSLSNPYPQKPIPPKEVCPLTAGEAGLSISLDQGQTTKNKVSKPGFAPLSVLTLFLVLLFLVVVLLSLFKRKACSHPCLSLASGGPSTSAHWCSPGTLEMLGSRNTGKTPQLQLSSWG